MKKLFKKQKGFTLIELMVSIAIFAFMTAFMLAKYGGFNQSILLTNLAYDVALTIRTAQSYGLNVKSADRNTSDFSFPYGVHFAKNDDKFIFFVDNDSSGTYNASDTAISTSKIKRGSKIYNLCAGISANNCSLVSDSVDITFRRPDPDAIIRTGTDINTSYTYTEITLSLSDDSATRRVSVYSTGQIAVMPN